MSRLPVTVVVPVRGPAPWLGEALESLADDDATVPVVLVEDGTHDQDENELRRLHPAVSLLPLPPVGRSQARNAGLARAETELVAFLDADDLTLPGRLEREAEALAADESAGLCCGRVEKIGAESELLAEETEREHRRFDRLLERGLGYESLLVDCPIYTSSTMIRRSAFTAAGGYRAGIDAFEDLDLYLRLARSATLVACPGPPVARHRLHSGNTSVDALFAGSAEVARLHLDAGAPTATARRLLVQRRLDALWGLGAFEDVRREAGRAAVGDPRLLAEPAFSRRLFGSLVPHTLLRSRRR